jgi:hypothetical protein
MLTVPEGAARAAADAAGQALTQLLIVVATAFSTAALVILWVRAVLAVLQLRGRLGRIAALPVVLSGGSPGGGEPLRITPVPSRPSPIRERIIKGAATGTPNPVGRYARPNTARPPARGIAPSPMRRVGAAPLAKMILVRAAGRRLPTRTIANPHVHAPDHLTSGKWPDLRSRWISLRRYGNG